MIDLAVATREETYERMQNPLAERGIRARAIRVSERTLDLATDEFEGIDVGFVFPPRLMEGGVVDALLDVPWVNDRDAILTSRNKAEVLATLGKTGIPVPKTILVSNPVDEADLRKAYRALDPPVVVKPNSTTRGVGVAKATDLDSFLGICDYLDLVHDYRATGDKAFLIQEYVPRARDYRVMVIDGEYVGAVERRLPEDAIAEGRWKHNVHRGAEASDVTLTDELRTLAERTADTVGIDWLGVDLLVNEDRALVNETNARPTIDAETKYEPDFYDRLARLIESRIE